MCGFARLTIHSNVSVSENSMSHAVIVCTIPIYLLCLFINNEVLHLLIILLLILLITAYHYLYIIILLLLLLLLLWKGLLNICIICTPLLYEFTDISWVACPLRESFQLLLGKTWLKMGSSSDNMTLPAFNQWLHIFGEGLADSTIRIILHFLSLSCIL